MLLTVTLRMPLPPRPRRLNDRSQIRYDRLPPQHSLNLGSVGDQSRGIARARRFYSCTYLALSHLARAFDHFKHGMTVSRPDVEGFGLASAAKMIERKNMRVSKV